MYRHLLSIFLILKHTVKLAQTQPVNQKNPKNIKNKWKRFTFDFIVFILSFVNSDSQSCCLQLSLNSWKFELLISCIAEKSHWSYFEMTSKSRLYGSGNKLGFCVVAFDISFSTKLFTCSSLIFRIMCCLLCVCVCFGSSTCPMFPACRTLPRFRSAWTWLTSCVWQAHGW